MRIIIVFSFKTLNPSFSYPPIRPAGHPQTVSIRKGIGNSSGLTERDILSFFLLVAASARDTNKERKNNTRPQLQDIDSPATEI